MRPVSRSAEVQTCGSTPKPSGDGAHQLLDSLLDRLPSDNLSTSPEELVQVFKTLSRANPKDDPPNGVQPKKNRLKFDVTDFKLSIELGTVTVAGKRVDVKASVPLAPLLGAVVGYSVARKDGPKNLTEQPAGEVETIQDGDRLFVVHADGTVSGVAEIPSAYRSAIERALVTQRIEIPDFFDLDEWMAKCFRNAPPEVQTEVTLLAPLKVVEADRPTFCWSGPMGAWFQVSIYDGSFNLYAQSSLMNISLMGTPNALPQFRWQPPNALQRGVRYAWQLKVRHQGTEFTVPRPPACEAFFGY
jgi:hypothetical protein